MLFRAARASIPIAVAVALSGCGGGAGGPAPPIDKATYVPPQQELMAPGPLGDRVLGKATAPVTVIEYVSLTCPHCANFEKTLFPRMKKEFIDTGKVRYIVREFPIGRTAGTAAIVNRCAPEDKYFFLLNQFLTRQPEWVSQEVRPDAIFSVAKASGMTRETFDKCLSNQVIIDSLTEVKQRGRQFGVIGTPTFFINGRKAQGEVTFDEIKAMIEQAPASAS
jgi:protein-disulfide isomerase